MGIGLLIEYLNNSKSLLRTQALLQDLCGLDLVLMDQESKCVALSSALPAKIGNRIEMNSNMLVRSVLTNKPDIEVPQDFLNHASEAREAVDFVCKDGLVKIVVPIIYSEQAVGYLLACENQTFRLNRSQTNTIKSFLNESLRQVVNNDFKFYTDFKASDVSHQKKTLYKVTQYINDNYKQSELTLADVAKQNNISYFYLSHLFKKELKTTFSNYLNNLRMDVAARLLKDRSLTISQISNSCGYEDPGYFSKVFKKIHGDSPVTYREKLLSKKNLKVMSASRSASLLKVLPK